MQGPLAGVKVVEVAMWAYVPSAGGMLSDMGAQVIKVEPPTGDPCRALATSGIVPGAGGFTAQWETYNRGKRSITIDLKLDGAVDLLHRLLEDADVFLVSLLPAARRAMKIDIDDIRARHPRIIYAIGSGTGRHGEAAEKGGFDYISFWSRGGVSAGVTPADHDYPLSMPSGAFGDCTSGAMLVAGINAALFQRSRTGQGCLIDGSLLAASMWAMQSKVTSTTLMEIDDLPMPSRERPNNPLVNPYRTSDERFIVMSMLQSQRYWPGLCRAIGHPELIEDTRFATAEARARNATECVTVLDGIFAQHPLSEVQAMLSAQEGQWDTVQRAGELFRDSEVVANRFMQDVSYADGRSLKMVSVPIQFDGEALPARPAPELGADSDAILADLGYDEDGIIGLKVAGVVF